MPHRKMARKKMDAVKTPAMKLSFDEEMEVIKETVHPKGGSVITFERQGRHKGLIVEALHLGWAEWYEWPSCVKVDYYLSLQRAHESWKVRNKYNPPVEITPPTPKGNPRRCMFCHDDMSGLAAHCLACGGAMHLSCAREGGDKCLTPGCGPD